jgi:hypothetical protein
MNNIPLKLELHVSDVTWQLELNLEEVDPFLHTYNQICKNLVLGGS